MTVSVMGVLRDIFIRILYLRNHPLNTRVLSTHHHHKHLSNVSDQKVIIWRDDTHTRCNVLGNLNIEKLCQKLCCNNDNKY